MWERKEEAIFSRWRKGWPSLYLAVEVVRKTRKERDEGRAGESGRHGLYRISRAPESVPTGTQSLEVRKPQVRGQHGPPEGEGEEVRTW